LGSGQIEGHGAAIAIEPVGSLISEDEDISQLFQYIKQINDALKYVHEKQIFHRDVSPKNIIVHNNNAILIDWGISKSFGTTTFNFSGTIMFASLAALRYFLHGQEFSYQKRDDFESLFYSLLHLISKGKLPWAKIKKKNTSMH